jgi:hypothetical protein
MKFILLIGFLTLSVCAAFVTVRLRSLNRKPDNSPPFGRNNATRNPVRPIIARSR